MVTGWTDDQIDVLHQPTADGWVNFEVRFPVGDPRQRSFRLAIDGPNIRRWSPDPDKPDFLGVSTRLGVALLNHGADEMPDDAYEFGAKCPDGPLERTIERMGRVDGISYFARPVEPMS